MNQKIADFINVLFGLRKFIAWVALFIVGIVFRLNNLIDGNGFVELMKSTFMGFVAANGVEHLVSAAKHYIDSKGALKTIPPSPIEEVVDGSTDDPDKQEK